MVVKTLLAAGALVAGLAFGAEAQMRVAQTTADLNMRAGPGTGNPVIAVIPAGADVRVHSCPSWCNVSYAGRTGWVSQSYLAFSTARAPRFDRGQRFDPGPRVGFRYGTPPRSRFGSPWWDPRYRTWRDARNWYWHDGRWHPRPRTGLFFEFGFGR